jgi:Domain of unknown function (DUF6249)
MHLGPFLVGVALFVFLAVATVAGVVGEYKKRQLAYQALRAAIERGQSLDPAVVDRLMAPEPRQESINPLHLRVGGIMTVASGIGVAGLSFFDPITLGSFGRLPLLGLGCVALCVGVGLLIAARVAERSLPKAAPPGP